MKGSKTVKEKIEIPDRRVAEKTVSSTTDFKNKRSSSMSIRSAMILTWLVKFLMFLAVFSVIGLVCWWAISSFAR